MPTQSTSQSINDTSIDDQIAYLRQVIQTKGHSRKHSKALKFWIDYRRDYLIGRGINPETGVDAFAGITD